VVVVVSTVSERRRNQKPKTQKKKKKKKTKKQENKKKKKNTKKKSTTGQLNNKGAKSKKNGATNRNQTGRWKTGHSLDKWRPTSTFSGPINLGDRKGENSTEGDKEPGLHKGGEKKKKTT